MIHIITGSTLGSAEYVGDHLSDLFNELGLEIEIHNQPNADDIPNEGVWMIVTSTHGAGDFPDNIQPFFQSIEQHPPRTDKLKFAVIAIGDSSYDTFCEAGKKADWLLSDIGAQQLVDCFTIDVQTHPVPEDAVTPWFEANKALFATL